VESSEQTATRAGTANVARTYFAAVAARDPDAMVACWEPGGVDRLVGLAELRAPDEVRAWFANLFAAVPDFAFEVLDLVTEGDRAAVRWGSRGTFDGTAKFEGVAPTGAQLELEGVDMLEVREGTIRSNHAYLNGLDLARQIGVLPPAGSLADRGMLAGFNARTAALDRLRRLRDR
jgi:predicted ester cyclase